MARKKTKQQLRAGIKELERRLKHQREEVAQARAKLGKPAFNSWYLARMCSNALATEKMLNGYKKALKRR